MICFPSVRDPTIYAFLIDHSSLPVYHEDLQRLGIGRQLYNCFTSTLAKTPDNWPLLLSINNMFTIVVARKTVGIPTVHKDMCPSTSGCASIWSLLSEDDIVIVGSLQVQNTEAYIWNMCKNSATCATPYASHYVFDAAVQLLKCIGQCTRISLNVDSSSESYHAALKSYTAYGFHPSLEQPKGVPVLLRLIGASSRFQRLDFKT